MKETMSKLGKLVFPVLFTVLGIVVTIFALTTSQSGSFLIASISIFLMGIITILLTLEILQHKLIKVFLFVLVPIAALIIILNYVSVQEQVKFDEEVAYRNKYVIQRLKDIRTAQALYKEANQKYAKTFDELIKFCKTGKLPFVKAIGSVPDTMTEAQAVKLGLVVRDTVLIPVYDTIIRAITTPIDSLPYIPFSQGEKFLMDAGEITQGMSKVPVFEVFAPDVYMYKGLDEQLVRNKNKDAEIKGFKLGDMRKPVNTGNWE